LDDGGALALADVVALVVVVAIGTSDAIELALFAEDGPSVLWPRSAATTAIAPPRTITAPSPSRIGSEPLRRDGPECVDQLPPVAVPARGGACRAATIAGLLDSVRAKTATSGRETLCAGRVGFESAAPGTNALEPGCAKGMSACAKASTLGKRASRSLASARRTICSSSGGTSGRAARRLGGSSTQIATAAAVVLPSKGVLPVSSSKRITPSAQMSVRASTCLAERICSGDM